MKKLLSLLLCAALLCSVLPEAAAGDLNMDSPEIRNEVLAVVNTDFSTEVLTGGSIRSETSGVITDAVTGEEYQLRSLRFPTPRPATFSGADGIAQNTRPLATAYSLGDPMIIGDNNGEQRATHCLYIGQHCTVWGAVEDDPAICISEIIAAELGSVFDGW